MSQCTRHALDEESRKTKTRGSHSQRVRGMGGGESETVGRGGAWGRDGGREKEGTRLWWNTGQRQDAMHHCRELSLVTGQSLRNREDSSSSRVSALLFFFYVCVSVGVSRRVAPGRGVD
jgi:hypothetical protein